MDVCEGAVVVVAGADKVVDLFAGRREDCVVSDKPVRVETFPAMGAGAAADALLVGPEAGGETELRTSD